MELRRYIQSDHDAVLELHRLALIDTGAFAERGPWDRDLDDIEEVYLQGGEFVVGVIDGVLVAIGALRKLSSEQGEVKRMRVRPELQRRGFGQAVLDYLEAAARRLGFQTLVLDTTSVQEAALAFYAKNGYRETGREQRSQFEVVMFEKMLRD